MLFGELGLILLVMEAGLDVDIQMVPPSHAGLFGLEKPRVWVLGVCGVDAAPP